MNRSFTNLNFIVTGCPRSGTGYISVALSKSGHPCGHEQVFTQRGIVEATNSHYEGDASWLAVPYLKDVPKRTVILHQTRHPLKVIGSMVALRYFHLRPGRFGNLHYRVKEFARHHVPFERPDYALLAYIRFIERHCPETFEKRWHVERATRFWLIWNMRIEELSRQAGLTYFRYRVEDFNPELLTEIRRHLGHEQPAQELDAISSVPRTYNHRGPSIEIEKSVIERTSVATGVKELARKYGYDL